MSKLGGVLLIFLVLFPIASLQPNGDQLAVRNADERGQGLTGQYRLRHVLKRGLKRSADSPSN
uniref:Conotoxin M superfamily protein n=1 Tax=Conus monile TaxID=351660 RepID=A0AA50QYA8_CONMO|nr:conotoxin precursor M superfamily protein [Conus monile]